MPPSPEPSRRYHHGSLRPALLEAAAAEIAEVGAAAMSLRRVAARAGVTHAAAAHHFGDKRGLLTALATDGHGRLAEALGAAGTDLIALGESYLRFAHEHRPWFEVMFRADLVRTDDPDYAAARDASFGRLLAAARERAGSRAAEHLAYGAWALVHGLAQLSLAGALPVAGGDELRRLFRRAARALAAPPR